MTNDSVYGYNLKYPDSFSLRSYQKETIAKTLTFFQTQETKSVYVANSPGLGKTITSIVAAESLDLEYILIVCPSIMRLVWEKEVKTWAPGRSVYTVLKSSDIDDLQTDKANYVIISYDLIWRDKVLRRLQELDFDLLIADEAHYLKSRSKRSSAFFKELFPNAVRHIFLSGTPFTTNVVDCYRPFHYIKPSEVTFKNQSNFVAAYSYQKETPWGVSYFGLKNSGALSSIIRNSFFIRYRKEDVLSELPPIQHTLVPLPIDYLVRKAKDYEDVYEKEAREALQKIMDDGKPAFSENLASMRRLQGEAKVPAVVEFAKELLEQNIPIVIFAYHKSVIEQLATQLALYLPVCITGDTPMKTRQSHIEDFQNGITNLIILNLIAGGTGITLTRSNNVLLAEYSWTPAENNQAISRCHRIGTKGQVNAYWFSVKDSIDEEILNVVMRRTKEFTKLFDKDVDSKT